MRPAQWDPKVHEHCLAPCNRYQPTPVRDGQQAIGVGRLVATVA